MVYNRGLRNNTRPLSDAAACHAACSIAVEDDELVVVGFYSNLTL
jgi:hypothetical protein